uniref:DUF3267 domain-containing protein n=1 Tax=Anaerobacillus isosaccharinicus TaxID=1532552 RepID=A0A1S2M5K3_9BACI
MKKREKIGELYSSTNNLSVIYQSVFSLLLLIYMIFEWKNFLNSDISNISTFIILALIFFHKYPHEFLHYITATFLGYKSIIVIKKRLCIIKGDIVPIHFIIIALSPLVFDLVIIVILWTLFPVVTFIGLSFIAISITSSSSDLYFATKAAPYLRSWNYYLRYNKQSHFTLYSK